MADSWKIICLGQLPLTQGDERCEGRTLPMEAPALVPGGDKPVRR